MSAILTPSVTAPIPPGAPPSPVGPRPWKWTREQYYKLGETGIFNGRRVELINGEILEMSPIGWPHSLAKALVVDTLRAAFASGYWVSEQSPVQAVASDPQPDVAVIPGSPRAYTGHPSNAVLIVEVADTSLFYDTTTKVELYAAAGVADYWVLDLDGKQLHVFRDPAPIPADGHTYRTRLTLSAADSVSPLAAAVATIRVADLLP
jgi:Uma2 family endonuclease